MQSPPISVIARDHTILGVCEALGEDFAINPLWLRAAFAIPLILDPFTVIGVYLAAGVIVLISRLLAPNPKRAAATSSLGLAETGAEQAPAADEMDQYPLPIAA